MILSLQVVTYLPLLFRDYLVNKFYSRYFKILFYLVIFVHDIEKWLDLKIITFLTTPLYVYLVSTRAQLQVCEITSSTTEIKEIFHNPAGSLLRGPSDDPSGRKIYLKLRSIQSEGRFLALDLAPRRSERKSPTRNYSTRVCMRCIVRRYHTHT